MEAGMGKLLLKLSAGGWENSGDRHRPHHRREEGPQPGPRDPGNDTAIPGRQSSAGKATGEKAEWFRILFSQRSPHLEEGGHLGRAGPELPNLFSGQRHPRKPSCRGAAAAQAGIAG